MFWQVKLIKNDLYNSPLEIDLMQKQAQIRPVSLFYMLNILVKSNRDKVRLGGNPENSASFHIVFFRAI